MKDFLLYTLALLTNGRPMHLLDVKFIDEDGRPVFTCRDQFGRMWYATGRWSTFRVKPAPMPIDNIKFW